jgi:pre-mRNA-splicing factor ISY1
MARPEEKSQSMLHRYLRSRAGDDGGAPGRPRGPRRPYLATLCEDVDEAGRWRQQVLRDISRKVSDIQNRASAPAHSFPGRRAACARTLAW